MGGMKVVAVKEFPEANLLRLWLGEEGGTGVRVQIRPSGTEPKVKIYGEAVGCDPTPFITAVAALLQKSRSPEGQEKPRGSLIPYGAPVNTYSRLFTVIFALFGASWLMHRQWRR